MLRSGKPLSQKQRQQHVVSLLYLQKSTVNRLDDMKVNACLFSYLKTTIIGTLLLSVQDVSPTMMMMMVRLMMWVWMLLVMQRWLWMRAAAA